MSKPRPPTLNIDALTNLKANTDKIDVLKARLLQFEKLRIEKKLPTTYIAFEALSSLLGGRVEGHSDCELRRAWPECWGDSTVEVPATLLKALTSAWDEYKGATSGRSLGEVFGVEGGGQGRSKMKNKQATRDFHQRLANEVASFYVAAGAAGEDAQPISLEEACAHIAQQYSISAELVKKAYAKYNPETLKGLKEKGILKG
jgi:hypothetical protein